MLEYKRSISMGLAQECLVTWSSTYMLEYKRSISIGLSQECLVTWDAHTCWSINEAYLWD